MWTVPVAVQHREAEIPRPSLTGLKCFMRNTLVPPDEL